MVITPPPLKGQVKTGLTTFRERLCGCASINIGTLGIKPTARKYGLGLSPDFFLFIQAALC
jgi:hypothetical protein